VNTTDAAVARIAKLLGDPTGYCLACGRLLRLIADGTMLPDHRRPIPGHSLCPGGEKPAVAR
jgi:hypothetical protein